MNSPTPQPDTQFVSVKAKKTFSKMKNKPKHLTNHSLEMVHKTNELILSKETLSEEEMDYVERLYWTIYDNDTKEDFQTIREDLKELGNWKIKQR